MEEYYYNITIEQFDLDYRPVSVETYEMKYSEAFEGFLSEKLHIENEKDPYTYHYTSTLWALNMREPGIYRMDGVPFGKPAFKIRVEQGRLFPTKRERYYGIFEDLELKRETLGNPVAYKVYFEAVRQVIHIMENANHFYDFFLQETKKRGLMPGQGE